MGEEKIIGSGRSAEILNWNADQVVKLFRDGWSISSAKKEEKITQEVFETGYPVPAVHGIIELKGRHGIIYDRVDGPSMLEELLSKPVELEYFASIFAKLHARMHSLSMRRLPSQRERLEGSIRQIKTLSVEKKG